MADSEVTAAIAILTFGGFAIQRVLEILDGPIAAISKNWLGSDSKPVFMGLLAVILAFVIVRNTDLNIMKAFGGTDAGISPFVGDAIFILVLSAGTEAVNIATKYFTYVKKARRFRRAPGRFSRIRSGNAG